MALPMKRISASGGRILAILLAVRGYSGLVFALAFQALPMDHDRRSAFLAVNGSYADHPPGADYEEETPLGVKAASLPLSVELLVAIVWVLMVCCMPLVSMKYDGRPITRTVITTTVVMLCSFLGGIWLFTNLLFFQSSHFEGLRSLTLVECVYLMAQVLTTVGYGDITPAKPRAQVFVALYVLFSLLIIANTVSEVSNTIAERLWEVNEEAAERAAERARSLIRREERVEEELAVDTTGTLEENEIALGKILQQKVPPLPWKNLRQKLTGWLFFVFLGVAFYANYPGEEKTMWQSVYYSIITLSTVGFGAFTALTPGGKAFGAFWMLFGSFSLLGLVGAFTEMMCVIRSREKWRIQKENVSEDELYKGLPEKVDLQGFIEFAVESCSLVQKKELETILRMHEDLCRVSGKAKISRDEALSMFEHEGRES